jgi:hypothetical protein
MKLSSVAALIIRFIGLGIIIMSIITFLSSERLSYSLIIIEILIGLFLILGGKPIGKLLCKGLEDTT